MIYLPLPVRKIINKDMKEYIFKLEMKVRDYECDLQGVVNNANYQHYMEHTRHEYLESLGENFGEMHEKGLDAFVAKVEIKYKHSSPWAMDMSFSCMISDLAMAVTIMTTPLSRPMERLKRSTAKDRASSRCPVGLCQIVSTMGSAGLGGCVQKNNSPPVSARKTKNKRKTPFLRKEETNDKTDRLQKGTQP